MFFLIFARAFCHRALLTLVSTLNLKHLKLQAEVFQVCKTGRCHNSSDGVKLTKGLWLLHTAPENHPLVLRTPPAAHHRCVQPCSQSLSCISAVHKRSRHGDTEIQNYASLTVVTHRGCSCQQLFVGQSLLLVDPQETSLCLKVSLCTCTYLPGGGAKRSAFTLHTVCVISLRSTGQALSAF